MENFFTNFSPISKKEANLINAQVLAFVGDSVHTLFVRTKLSLQSAEKSGKLHIKANKFVRASAQSEVIENIIKFLNDEELYIFKRARNYKTISQAKHSTVLDYKKATGFEAVLGYLFLTGEFVRLDEILNTSYNLINSSGL